MQPKNQRQTPKTFIQQPVANKPKKPSQATTIPPHPSFLALWCVHRYLKISNPIIYSPSPSQEACKRICIRAVFSTPTTARPTQQNWRAFTKQRKKYLFKRHEREKYIKYSTLMMFFTFHFPPHHRTCSYQPLIFATWHNEESGREMNNRY